MRTDIVILDGARTPFGTYCGSLHDVTATDLGVVAARGALERARVAPADVDQVIFGNVIQTSADAIYLARHVGLKAGCPIETPGLTLNRLCGSGFQAVVTAAQQIQLGEAQVVLAGGAENMSQAPHVIRGARWGLPLFGGQLEDALWASLNDPYAGCSMAITAENLGEQYGVTRKDVDDFAYVSQMRANEAWEKGRLAEEVVPVPVKGKKGKETSFERDEHLRPHTTPEGLEKLKPVFKPDGLVTAGNASGICDGAGALVVTSAEVARRRGWKALGRVLAWAVAGVAPKIMGIGPAPAIRGALKRANLALDDMDLVEVNEAFAAQYLAVEKELKLDRERTNVNGGAIALGHPVGASGARILLTLLYELRRRGDRYGVGSACIGGGMGIAVIVENLKH
ncbi:MAG TPA: acetyl-CoA C-acetyltransferase [Candidatus Sulfotelmatobacter sp.]|nr:acetyl-CoA C-acetyltransferase [Candidatus Sulfotelmatobacter sp.]